MVGVPHPTCRKNQGKNLSRDLKLSDRQRALARKKRHGKWAMRKAARAKRRMPELTFGTFNVRTAAFKGVNVIGHIDVRLRICAAKG